MRAEPVDVDEFARIMEEITLTPAASPKETPVADPAVTPATEPDDHLFDTQDDGKWKMDLDAFVPVPEGHVKVNGKWYPIFSFLDLESEESLKVTRLGVEIRDPKVSFEDQQAKSVEQVLLLNSVTEDPELRLSAEDFKKKPGQKGIRPRQLVALSVLAMSIAKVPLKAGAGSSDPSATTSPASADSTGGAPATS